MFINFLILNSVFGAWLRLERNQKSVQPFLSNSLFPSLSEVGRCTHVLLGEVLDGAVRVTSDDVEDRF